MEVFMLSKIIPLFVIIMLVFKVAINIHMPIN